MPHEKIVHQVLQMIGKRIPSLKEQIQRAGFLSLEDCGAGFYYNFSLNREGLKPYSGENPIEIVYGKDRKGKDVAGFLLWFKEGYIDFLEGYCYESRWPDEESMVLFARDR